MQKAPRFSGFPEKAWRKSPGRGQGVFYEVETVF